MRVSVTIVGAAQAFGAFLHLVGLGILVVVIEVIVVIQRWARQLHGGTRRSRAGHAGIELFRLDDPVASRYVEEVRWN
jgi:hypothetical protein